MSEQTGADAARNVSADREISADGAGDDYEHHGGFPVYEPVKAGPNYGTFVETFRRLQDLMVSTHAPDDVIDRAIEQTEALVELLAPYEVPEGRSPAGFNVELPGRGSALLLPWKIEKFGEDGVRERGMFRRYHLGGNGAAHGGTLPLLFDDLFGMVIHANGRPIARTGYLHVNYRKITPIETELVVDGWVDRVEGRKAYCKAELRDLDGNLLADSEALMIQLLPGQQ
ncbi:PaaI family thioesterase [Rhodococcus coprophilus]|uniref:Acyl-coenzyme A thioesterase THEM4 n=1 Tax=Rhodococcus coprophilus TaxID=38310 RepID=A0A2X4UNX8_9NOCA|nr:PaaI family thioesterase [Rhodococcus coprophilus]MBM7459808.1 acyl-coenzyme A thioesterase PaaI-like protein [Rhodococcus coprophilus]SQI37338.1 thioesterase [Rhodococcus coprophilus]